MKAIQERCKSRFILYYLHKHFTKIRNEYGYLWWDIKQSTSLACEEDKSYLDRIFDDCGMKSCKLLMPRYAPSVWSRVIPVMVRYMRIKNIVPSRLNMWQVCTQDFRCEEKTWQKIHKELGGHDFYFIEGVGKECSFVPVTDKKNVRALKEFDELNRQMKRAKMIADNALKQAQVSFVRKEVSVINKSIKAAKQAMEA